MLSPGPHPLRGLLLAQFCGAFNDNAWKLVVALLGMRAIATTGAVSGPALEAASQTQTTTAFVVFTVPLMLISLPAGVLADRVSKRSIIITMKAIEVGLMAAGAAALLLAPSGGVLPLVVLGLMGVHSALFSPAKYGILPEILPHEQLSSGNGILEMCTFFAIIAGTYAGGLLIGLTGDAPWIAGLVLTLFATAGFAAAWAVPRVKAARSDGGLGATLKGAWAALGNDRVLRLAVLGSIFFWGIASLVGQEILVYAKAVLRLPDAASGLPLAVLAAGIGLGGVLAGRLSGPKVEYGLIPLGAIGLSLFILLLGVLAPGLAWTLVIMVLLGLASGLLVVPLNALIQWRAPEDRRGAVIALANTFVFAGILAGSLAAEGLSRAGLAASGILVVASMVTLAGTVWALLLLPDAFLRLVLVLLTHTLYRLTVVGRANVPQRGGALLVPNHVSFVDGLFLLASLDRPIRFVVEAEYAHHPLLRPFMNSLGVIPVSASGGPRVILRALREAGGVLDAGAIACIFPEGQITRTGTLLPFRRGYERIAKGRTAPIIPVHLDRVWGSIFSYAGGRFLTKVPERVPYPVTVSFGAPLPPGTPAHEVRRAVEELGEAAWALRKTGCLPLSRAFIRAMRRHPARLMWADATRPRVSRLRALAGAIAFARALAPRWAGQDAVGVLLPPGVAGALANFAATLAGRIAVNLNYSAGRAGMESAARQAGLSTVVTSRMFLERAKLDLPGGLEPIWAEEVAAGLGRGARTWAFLLALFAPPRVIERACGMRRRPGADDPATVIFTSGSTGEPKGVVLSHFNIQANVDAVAQVFPMRPADRLLGVLPFFHSFGYTATLWLAAIHGMGVVFHPTPLEAGAIGELVRRYRVTFLIVTPTFLQLYQRRCTPEEFGSLRVVLTGAEKLPDRLAQAFEDRFGIRPFEGYGITECSPVITVSGPGFRSAGLYQPGARRGHVGQPLPGVSVRIVDPESFEPLPPGMPGMLLVKGPNVMRGYLGRDDLTATAMRDGWYVTGDMASVDEDGFVQITDRLSRFSKIGGEMIPHGRVEEALHEAAGVEEKVFAVTAIPDERKGERLVALHTLREDAIPGILDQVGAQGLPNLYIPRRDHFLKVDRLPILGSGKLDLREVKRIALEKLAVAA
ncbi:MAG TPA: acyl-[ACP]--phospholipid O-acyltransferase [Candidatus Methylomirabilis sp.]|nr:acyl-[ACP]--phospholipid O-acyltransferase [Candidatus Methylomirabilis sp.]